MKGLPLFILLLFTSCQQGESTKKKKNQPAADSSGLAGINKQPAAFVFDPEFNDTCALFRFVQRNLNRDSIVLFNNAGLEQKTGYSKDSVFYYDTCYAGSTTFIQIINEPERKLVGLKIDGFPVKPLPETPMILASETFRHFRFKSKEFYFIRAGHFKCGGSICAEALYLIYEKKNRRLNLFSSFRVKDHVFAGDLNGDERLDFLDMANDGMWGPPGGPNNFQINIYSCNEKGWFVPLTDKNKKAYFLSGNTGADLYLKDTLNIEESHWPVPLK
jgi:hypothetical protein